MNNLLSTQLAQKLPRLINNKQHRQLGKYMKLVYITQISFISVIATLLCIQSLIVQLGEKGAKLLPNNVRLKINDFVNV